MFWVVPPRGLVVKYQRFREIYCLHMKMLVSTCESTRRHNPKEEYRYLHHRESLRSHNWHLLYVKTSGSNRVGKPEGTLVAIVTPTFGTMFTLVTIVRLSFGTVLILVTIFTWEIPAYGIHKQPLNYVGNPPSWRHHPNTPSTQGSLTPRKYWNYWHHLCLKCFSYKSNIGLFWHLFTTQY
jgi:hypothetical protein